MKEANKKTPKYLLWWHDSFLERDRYANPSPMVSELLLEGVPGPAVEYILFINSLQFHNAQQFFQQVEESNESFTDLVHQNHDVIYNTTSLYIDSYEDLESSKHAESVKHFLDLFSVEEMLQLKNVTFDNTLFMLQHTRVVPRKRIDFAIEYCYSLLYTLRNRGMYKAMYFLISGYSGDEGSATRRSLERLHKKLSEKYKIDTFFLIFAEDYDKHAIPFEEYPRIVAKLGGMATYFSEIEGFGNNLLEVLASGLVPIVYTYPVFKSDIEKYKFKLIALDDFIVDVDSQLATIEFLKSSRRRKIWVNRNLTILKKSFPHQIISRKLRRAILRKRLHK